MLAPYNQGPMIPADYDPANQYIGVVTPLDKMFVSKAPVSANPADPQWGGHAFTQAKIDEGVYKKDEIMQKSIFLNKPNLVVSATDHSTLDAICKTKDTNTFDIVEIRLDQLVQEKNLKEKISSISHPLLLTCRHPKEGGQNNISDPLKRISLIEPLLPFASAIDIELSEFDKMKNIVSEAKSKGIKIILSYHNVWKGYHIVLILQTY